MSVRTLADTSDGANYRGRCGICGSRVAVPMPGVKATGKACEHFAHVERLLSGEAYIVCDRPPLKIQE